MIAKINNSHTPGDVTIQSFANRGLSRLVIQVGICAGIGRTIVLLPMILASFLRSLSLALLAVSLRDSSRSFSCSRCSSSSLMGREASAAQGEGGGVHRVGVLLRM